MRRGRAGRRAEAGFTLVELLVSLALLSMAAVLVGQGFAADRGALGRMETRTASVESVAAAQDLIRDCIERLFARTRYDAQGATVELEGASDRLAWLAWAGPGSATAAPVQPMALSLEDGDRLRLATGQTATAALVDPGAPAGALSAAGDDGTLLRGVRRLEIAYYGPAKAGAPPAWRADWTRQPGPPTLVRIELAFAPGDRRVWPELIVRPAVTVDTGCVLDPETSLCRGRS